MEERRKKQIEYLFVGGSKDGERLQLEQPFPAIHFPIFPEDSFLAFDKTRPPEATYVKRDTYYRRDWTYGRHDSYPVYYHNSIPEEETVPYLLNGYHTPEHQRLKKELQRCKEELRALREMFGLS